MREFKHVTAAELEDFQGKPIKAQLTEIWLNGKETDGAVVDVIARVDALEPEVLVHLEVHRLEMAEIGFVKRWGGRGTGFLAVLVSTGTAIGVIAGRWL